MMDILKDVNKIAEKLGYVVIPCDVWNKIKNEIASLNDAINVYEHKEEEK
jgi:hypothetical protein